MGLFTRRQLIGAAAGLTFATNTIALPAAGLSINPRSSWGSNHPPTGPLPAEDVKFLLVHHSASRNSHTSADVPAILRSWFSFHTGPEKGWNDVAYNFVIDSEGAIWEGRQGSLAGAVAGDATGGNQGFTQLVCVIGDFNSGQPTAAALNSLTWMLAWLADRHGVATSAGSEVTFTSRGSNSWPANSQVTTPTITGHRDMSKTSCPGNNLYPYVVGPLMADVHSVRGGAPVPRSTTTTIQTTSSTSAPAATTTTAPAATTTTPAPVNTTTEAATTTTVLPPTTTTTRILPSTTTSVTSTTAARSASTSSSATLPPTTLPAAVEEVSTSSGVPPVLSLSAAIVVAATGLLLWRQRRLGG